MSDSQIEEIKNRLNVLDVVGSYVKLTKTGVNHRGICPFHAEKGPSFFVSPGRQMWKCFGCGAGGDIFEFTKRIEGVEFGDALRILAQKAGVELKRENPQLRTERQRLYEICDLACSFFEKQLRGSEWGIKAKDYLLKRGITEESIKKWRLGYSPDTWQGLSDFLVGRGYTRNEIIRAGLAVQSEKGNNPYDRFRGRIIFPIFDISSQPIGFGARIFKEADKKETAKYINTPQTMLYDKSNVLYGINYAKVAIRKGNNCVLTEGYTDAIMCHQAGFENTVAVSGTALTPRHLTLLKRYTENLLLAFDMDLAGDNATKRGITLAESQGFNLKIIDTYSGAKDPAEIIQENPKNWQDSIEKARSLMDYYFDSSLSRLDKSTPSGKKEIAKIILPAIKRLPNKIEQSHWVGKLAQKLDVKEEAIMAEMSSLRGESVIPGLTRNPETNLDSRFRGNDKVADNGTEGRKKLIEEKIISLIAKDPASLNLIEDYHHNLFCEKTKSLIEKIKQNVAAGADFNSAIAGISSAEDYKGIFDALALKAEVNFEDEGSDEIQLCLAQLRDINIREKRVGISAEIKRAEQEKDFEKVDSLIKDFNLIN